MGAAYAGGRVVRRRRGDNGRVRTPSRPTTSGTRGGRGCRPCPRRATGSPWPPSATPSTRSAAPPRPAISGRRRRRRSSTSPASRPRRRARRTSSGTRSPAAPSEASVRRRHGGGGPVWLFGGIGDGGTASTDTAAYDRAINTWTPEPKLPRPVHHAAAVTYGDDAVLIGGFVPGAELTSGQSDRVYVLRGGSWEELPPLNHAARRRRRRGRGRQDRRGRRPGRPEARAADGGVRRRALDGRGRHPDAARAPRRAPPTAATCTRSAGASCPPTKNLAALERYDPASDTWTKLDDMPKASAAPGPPSLADWSSPSAARAHRRLRRGPGLRRQGEALVAAAGSARPATGSP